MTSLERATPAQAAALAALHAAADPGGEPWTTAAMAAQLGLPGTFGWIAPGPAGLVLARVAADVAEILTLAVLPGARRRGVGTALLAAAAQEAARSGARTMFLEVSTGNAAALALYHGAGFAPCGRRRAYYRDGADAVVMRASLLYVSTDG